MGYRILNGYFPVSSPPVCGYHEAIPSIEVAKKIAQAFEVTLDYIGGEGTSASFDKKTIKRIQQIEDLPESDRTHLLLLLMHFLEMQMPGKITDSKQQSPDQNDHRLIYNLE